MSASPGAVVVAMVDPARRGREGKREGHSLGMPASKEPHIGTRESRRVQTNCRPCSLRPNAHRRMTTVRWISVVSPAFRRPPHSSVRGATSDRRPKGATARRVNRAFVEPSGRLDPAEALRAVVRPGSGEVAGIAENTRVYARCSLRNPHFMFPSSNSMMHITGSAGACSSSRHASSRGLLSRTCERPSRESTRLSSSTSNPCVRRCPSRSRERVFWRGCCPASASSCSHRATGLSAPSQTRPPASRARPSGLPSGPGPPTCGVDPAGPPSLFARRARGRDPGSVNLRKSRLRPPFRRFRGRPADAHRRRSDPPRGRSVVGAGALATGPPTGHCRNAPQRLITEGAGKRTNLAPNGQSPDLTPGIIPTSP